MFVCVCVCVCVCVGVFVFVCACNFVDTYEFQAAWVMKRISVLSSHGVFEWTLKGTLLVMHHYMHTAKGLQICFGVPHA